MQPPGAKRRQIERPLRPDGPLVYERLSDPILVRRAKDGDRRALEALCARHAPKVERLAFHLLDDHEDARDAAQEALTKLCTRLRQFRGESQFSTWLHRLAVNVVIERRRSFAIQRERIVDDPSALDLVTVAPARADLTVDFEHAIEQLPPGAREIFVLHDVEGYKHREIAVMLAITTGTSKRQLHRARMLMRKHLDG